MPHVDSETLATMHKAADVVREHETQIRAALAARRDHFVQAATEARTAHLAGALNEPPPEGHVLILNNASLRAAAELFRVQAEACVSALKALNAAVEGDDYDDYEIYWTVQW